MIEQRVTLRYGAQQIPAIVQAVQGDTGRDVIFELADYEIPAGATANYYIDKPDDTAIYNSAEVISSTEILAHLTEQALAVPGRNNGQVRILSDDEVITSFDFVLEVEAFRGLMRMQSETEVNIFDEAIQRSADEAIASAIEEIQAQTPVVTGMQNSIAPTYSASSTYRVGDYVMYNTQLYKCIDDITETEAWNAEHWEAVALGSDVIVLRSDLGERFYSLEWENAGWINYANGAVVASSSWYNCDFIPVVKYQTIRYFTNIAGNAGVAFYDDAKNYISGYHDSDGLKERVIAVPDGAKYFRMSCHAYSVADEKTKIIYFINLSNFTYDSVKEIETRLESYGENGYVKVYSPVIYGKVWNINGGYVDVATGAYISLFVNPGDVFILQGYQVSTYYSLGIILNGTSVVKPVAADANGTVVNYEVHIPDGADRIIVNGNTDTSRPVIYKKISKNYLTQDYAWKVVETSALSNIIAQNGSEVATGHHLKIDVFEGEHYKISGKRWSDWVPSWVISDGTNVIAFETGETTEYFTDLEVTIPAGGRILYVNGNAIAGLRCVRYSRIEAADKHKSLIGKTMVWFGTSIPQNSTWFDGENWSIPSYAGHILGMNVINECYGASIAARGIYNQITENDPYGWTGVSWYAVFRALGADLVEKQDLIDNYESKWYDLLGGSTDPLYVNAKPQTLTDALKAEIISCSYENRLIPYIDGTKTMPDLFVFEHGYNDSQATVFSGISPDEEHLNRSLYSDAMYFFFQKIFEANPQAKILVVSHYENTSEVGKKTFDAQKELAEYHGVFFCDVADKTGWSQRLVKTTGYWDNGVWIESGGTERTITRLAQCIPDQVHPHTDKSGNAVKREAQIIADYIAANINLD